MSQAVILFGPSGAGKTLAASFLAEIGWHQISVSRTIQNISGSKSQLSRKELLLLGQQLVTKNPSEITRALLQDSKNHEKVVIDGLRCKSIAEHLIQELNPSILYIDANLKTRASRVQSRDRMSLCDFHKMQCHPFEKHIEQFKSITHYLICNDDSLTVNRFRQLTRFAIKNSKLQKKLKFNIHAS